MKKIRKAVCLITAVAVLLIFVGCNDSESKKDDSEVDTYKNLAQGFIDEKDYDSAIKVLLEGVDDTKDEELIAILKDVERMRTESKAQTTQPPVVTTTEPQTTELQTTEPQETTTISKDSTSGKPAFDIAPYLGRWEAYRGNGDVEGGCILEISRKGNGDIIEFTYEENSGGSRDYVALVTTQIKLKDIKSKTIKMDFDEDGWGHSGTFVYTFCFGDVFGCGELEHYIEVAVKNYRGDTSSNWGVQKDVEDVFYNVS